MTEVNKDYLDQVSAARYEAQTFLSKHPEFFATPANGHKIVNYMQEHNLKLNAENYEYAFEKLKGQGELLPGREALATMSAEEFKQFAKTHGTPVSDEVGRVSYELPDAYLRESTESYNRPRYTQNTPPVHPEDAKRNPSKREFAFWNSSRQRDWLIARGYWGKNLPDFLTK